LKKSQLIKGQHQSAPNCTREKINYFFGKTGTDVALSYCKVNLVSQSPPPTCMATTVQKEKKRGITFPFKQRIHLAVSEVQRCYKTHLLFMRNFF